MLHSPHVWGIIDLGCVSMEKKKKKNQVHTLFPSIIYYGDLSTIIFSLKLHSKLYWESKALQLLHNSPGHSYI